MATLENYGFTTTARRALDMPVRKSKAESEAVLPATSGAQWHAFPPCRGPAPSRVLPSLPISRSKTELRRRARTRSRREGRRGVSVIGEKGPKGVKPLPRCSQMENSVVDQDDKVPVSPKSSVNMFPRSSLSLVTSVSETQDNFLSLTPIEMDLGALEVIASLPDTSPRKEMLKRSATRAATKPRSKNHALTIGLPNGASMTVITPEESAWQRALYLPGRIIMTPKRRIGSSPLTVIQETVIAELGLDTEKTAAENAIIDDLVSFIEDFGQEFRLQMPYQSSTAAIDIGPAPRDRPSTHESPRGVSTGTNWFRLSEPTTIAPRNWNSSTLHNEPGDYFHPLGDNIDFDTLLGPSMFDNEYPRQRRGSMASTLTSGSFGTMLSHTPDAKQPHSFTPMRPSFAARTTSYTSSIQSPMSGMYSSKGIKSPPAPRKIREVKKAKGAGAKGQRISLRSLWKSAASIV